MPTKPNGTTLLVIKSIAAIAVVLTGGGIGFAMRPMVAEEDANTRVSIGVMQSIQEAIAEDVKEHHDKIGTLETGITIINVRQEAAAAVHTRIEKTLEKMGRKIDEIPKSE